MRDITCPYCGKLLAKNFDGHQVSIKCQRCKMVTNLVVTPDRRLTIKPKIAISKVVRKTK